MSRQFPTNGGRLLDELLELEEELLELDDEELLDEDELLELEEELLELDELLELEDVLDDDVLEDVIPMQPGSIVRLNAGCPESSRTTSISAAGSKGSPVLERKRRRPLRRASIVPWRTPPTKIP
jgi:hypothetical protein